MNDLELRAWTSFIDVVKNFIGNHRTENYREVVENLLKSLQDIDANISIQIHFYIAILINFRIIVTMWVMCKKNDSIRISKQ